MQKIKSYALLIGIALLFMQCNSSYVTPTEKCSENDPFKNTMVKSQYFEFSADEDQVKEGTEGTVIAFPKGCFVDKNGNVVKGAVKVELAEAFSMQDMINSNLTTSSEGKSLETAGMVYFNVKTADGEQLGVNADNPIYIEIPTDEREAGMQVYKGERDENGMTNWVAPQPIKSYLVTVDINLLNFLPQGFGETVEKRIPFSTYTEATQRLKDSLYYSLSGVSRSDIYKRYEGVNLDLNINEQHHYNSSPTGSLTPSNHYDPNDYKAVLIQDPGYPYEGMSCGIDPAIIKTIKNEKFAKSYIATRAFEARLKVIFKTCRDDVLELYINNLEKDLWQVDELAAELLKDYPKTDPPYQEPDLNCKECNFEEQFLKFAAQKLTNVEDAGKQAALLKEYYNKKIKATQEEIQSANTELKKAMETENEAAKEKVEEYKDLLWEREKYRMETYGFEFESTGWVNVDKPMPIRTVLAAQNESTEKTCHTIAQLDVKLAEGKSYERAYIYMVYSDIQSMRRMDSDNQELFVAKHNSRQGMVIYNNTPAILVGVAYNGDTPYIAVKKFVITADEDCNQHLDMTLTQTTVEQLNKTLGEYDNYSPANRISKDLEYQAAFAVEKKRQEKLADERDFLLDLWQYANYCCRYAEH